MANGFGVRNPGQYLTQRNRLAQMLMQGRSPNTGTATGGLAHVLRQGMAGYLMGEDARSRQAAMQAMGTPLTPQTPPLAPGVEGPPAPPVDPYAARIGALQGLGDNEYAAMYMAQQQSLADQLRMQDQQREFARTQQLEDQARAFEQQKDLMGLKAGMRQPVPGKDVPYSEDVLDQLTQIATARSGAAAQAKADVKREMTRQEAEAALPDVTAKAEYTKQLVDDIVNHPAMSNVVGAPESLSGVAYKMFGAAIPGTMEADFAARLEQLGGRQFLEAFESLKGGGQITEVEGKKATDAMSRLMQTGQPEETYRKAAQELKEVMDSGVARAQRAAGVTGQEQPQLTAPQISPPSMIGQGMGLGAPQQGGWSIKRK